MPQTLSEGVVAGAEYLVPKPDALVQAQAFMKSPPPLPIAITVPVGLNFSAEP